MLVFLVILLLRHYAVVSATTQACSFTWQMDQCFGLQYKTASTWRDCMTACCDDVSCDVWQFDNNQCWAGKTSWCPKGGAQVKYGGRKDRGSGSYNYLGNGFCRTDAAEWPTENSRHHNVASLVDCQSRCDTDVNCGAVGYGVGSNVAKLCILYPFADYSGVGTYPGSTCYVKASNSTGGRHLSMETVTAAYAGVVDDSVDSSVTVIGEGAVAAMSNDNLVQNAMATHISHALPNNNFGLSVVATTSPQLTQASVVVTTSTSTLMSVSSLSDSASTSTTPASALNSSPSASPTTSSIAEGEASNVDGALLTCCAHPLLVLLGLAINFF